MDVGNAVTLFTKRIAPFGHMLSPDLSGFQMTGNAEPVGAIARELCNGNAVYTSNFTSHFFYLPGCGNDRDAARRSHEENIFKMRIQERIIF